MPEDVVTMDKIVALCKRRGLIFPASDIYGGIANTYDYGHYGVLLKRNVIDAWWQSMIVERDDIVALDSAIIQHPRTWEASGHVGGFTDPLVDCKTCGKRFRADHLGELQCPQKPSKHPGEGPDCDLTEAREFNLMFQTTIGPVAGVRRDRLPAPRDRAGHLPGLQDRPDLRAQAPAVRHRAGRQVLPQRDHAGQLRLPHAGVRADGDGVLRAARRGPAVARALAGRAHGLVRAHRDPRRPPAPARPRRRRAQPLLERAPATSSTSTPSAGASWRASPTAATSTSPSTRSSPARSSRSTTRRPTSATCRTSSSRPPASGRTLLAVLVRRLRRGRPRRRAAHGAQAASAPGADQGRRAAARAQGRPARARARDPGARCAGRSRSSTTRAARSASATAARTRSARRGA